jgi:putative membrane protein
VPPTVATIDTGTRLAVDRTWLAHERTMLAWVRTAASLISFGFTIYKFFQLEIGKLVADRPEPLIGPREFAMILIATGIGSLILAFVEHRRSDRQLRESFGDIVPRSVAGVVASIVGGLGALAIIVVIFRQ